MPPDPFVIFKEVAIEKRIAKKWSDAPHEAFKHLANSSKGDAGEEFIRRYALALGFEVAEVGSRLGDWDLEIQGKTFEIKTATEDVAGSFQFNHVRYDSKYQFLLCFGVSPSNLHFRIWNKAEVTTGGAGNLVTMGKGQNASFKLTKKPRDLYEIAQLKEQLDSALA